MSATLEADTGPYSQKGRRLKIDTSLGKDLVFLNKVEGFDALSRLFRFKISLATRESGEKVHSLLGQSVTLTMTPGEAHPGRPVNGMIKRLTGGTLGAFGFRFWHAEVVPKFAFLCYDADCRIFQNKSVIDIVEQVLREHDLTDFEFRVQRDKYPKLDYCVQYRESTMDFVSRLLESAGIYYWHEHYDGRHVMVIADQNRGAQPVPGGPVNFSHHEQDGDLTALEHDYAYQSGKRSLTDYNFETPATSLLASTPTVLEVPGIVRHEVYDYPGDYTRRDVGTQITRLRIEADEARYHRLNGTGSIADFDAGRQVKIDDLSASPIDCLLVEVRHFAEDFTQFTIGAREAYYKNNFVVLPMKVPFRPELLTPRPFVHGPQTAVVTGPGGEEIYTDKYGRVKVQFHWDRKGNTDENSSCWLRVSQAWAGAGFGSIQIPRIGQEVIVDFLEGDPDQPIITGRVYNALQMPPHALPGSAVKSGLKSNSTKGGGGSNELTFDDTKGKEKSYFHSQFDHEAVIEHDETRHVKNDRSVTVDGTSTEVIKKKTSITVTEGDYSHTVTTGTATIVVKGKVSETFQNTQDTTVRQSINIVSTSSHVHVTAATDIILEVGASKLSLFSDGRIELSGKAVAIKGTDAVNISGLMINSDAGKNHNITGALVMSDGSVSNTVKGAMVMLNP